jgi:hypothetical protein
MVLDIQTVHHILKKYSSSKCKQTVCLHTELTSTLSKLALNVGGDGKATIYNLLTFNSCNKRSKVFKRYYRLGQLSQVHF